MGIIGRIIGVGQDSKQKSDEKWAKKNEQWQKENKKLNEEQLEKVKLRLSEGKEEHVVNVLMEGTYGMERITDFITRNPGIIPSYVLPTEELKRLNGDNLPHNNQINLETQKQILQLEKEKLAMQLEIERLKQSLNNAETNLTDSKINKLMSWGYSKEKANKVSDEDFERLEYWYNKDKKFFNDLLEIELGTVMTQHEQISE